MAGIVFALPIFGGVVRAARGARGGGLRARGIIYNGDAEKALVRTHPTGFGRLRRRRNVTRYFSHCKKEPRVG